MSYKLFTQSIHARKLFLQANRILRGTLHRFERHASNQNRRTQPGAKMGEFTEKSFMFLPLPLLTFYLGCWQLKRKKWKESLIEQLNALSEREPDPLPDNLEELANMELRPIKVRGEFDYTHETYLGPKSHTMGDSAHTAAKRSGVHVVTPFRLADRDLTILINRGFLDAAAWEKKERRLAAQVHGELTLVGAVRLDQNDHLLVNYVVDTHKKLQKHGITYFTHRHIDQLAEECHADPVYLDALSEQMAPNAPFGVRPIRDLRNDHLQYAFTWFIASFALMSYWIRKHMRPLRPAVIRASLQKRDAIRKNRK